MASLFFEASCPEDVLLLIFECLSSSRDVMALCSASNGNCAVLLPSSLAAVPTVWARAARSKLRSFLPAGPLFTYADVYFAEDSQVNGPFGPAFPFYHDAVGESTESLYATLAGALSVPIPDVSAALELRSTPPSVRAGRGHEPCKAAVRRVRGG